jgi:hypothetical protein
MATCTQITTESDKVKMTLSGQTRTIVYKVVFDSNQVGPWDAQHASCGDITIPLLSSLLAGVTVLPIGTIAMTFIVADVEASRLPEDPKAFKVTVTIEPLVPGNEQKPDGTNVKWRIQLSGDPILYTEPATVDRDGFPVLLPDGEPIIPPLLQEHYDRDYAISFRADQLDFDDWDACAGCTNSESITMTIKGQTKVFAVDTLKFAAPRFAVGYNPDGSSYWEVQYRLQHRIDTWVQKLQPYSINHEESGNIVPNRDDVAHRPISRPMPLNAGGTDYIRPGGAMPDPRSYNIPSSVSFAGILDGLMGIP